MNFIKNLWEKILALFGIKTKTTNKEYDDNQKYAIEYQTIRSINFTSIFASKLSKYCSSQSSIVIDGDNKRAEYLNDMAQKIWKKRKRIFNRMYGMGGVFVLPYYQKGEIQYNIIPQFRVSINEMIGEKITNITLLADVYVQKNGFTSDIYYRWADYRIVDNTLYIQQRYTNEQGEVIPKPDYWKNIDDTFSMTGVDRILGGYFKSTVDNRQNVDNYGVPITYGTDSTIAEIRECLKQIAREFKNKEAFVGVDFTMFNSNNGSTLGLPEDGVYRKFNGDKEDLWEIFDPAIRDSSYYARLQELYARLEKEVGTSRGILTELETSDATATAIRKAMYDTFTIVDDTRVAFEDAMKDVIYSINAIANYYNITPQGEYDISFDWGYDLLEDPQQDFNQLIQGKNNGVIKRVEIRQWLRPNETLEESEKALKEIDEEEPSIEKLIGGNSNA